MHSLKQENLRQLIESRDYQRILECLDGLIGGQVRDTIPHIRTSAIDEDDLRSCAHVAIIKAVDSFVYNESQSEEQNRAAFLCLAGLRVKTALMDEKNKFISPLYMPRRIAAKVDKAYAIIQGAKKASQATLIRVIMHYCKASLEEARQLYRIACVKYVGYEVDEMFMNEMGVINEIPVDDPFVDELIFHNLKEALLSEGQIKLVDAITRENETLESIRDRLDIPSDYLRGKCISSYQALQEGRHGTIHSKRRTRA